MLTEDQETLRDIFHQELERGTLSPISISMHQYKVLDALATFVRRVITQEIHDE